MNQNKLKSTISAIAVETSSTFNEIWHRLVMERFLARLSASEYRSYFIFKGGYLLTRYTGIHRETRDLDFVLNHMNANKSVVQVALEEIAEVKVEDGFNFKLVGLDDLSHEHMRYPGFQARFLASYETMKEPLVVDIGVGDIIEPIEEHFKLLRSKISPFFEEEAMLKIYPAAFIFSEKLETAVRRGDLNSRMKDYHDIYVLINLGLLDRGAVKDAILKTFAHRDVLLSSLPLLFSAEAMQGMQTKWRLYVRKSKFDVPQDFAEIVDKINLFLNEIGVVSG